MTSSTGATATSSRAPGGARPSGGGAAAAADVAATAADLARRDRLDSTRKVNPLQQAPDAVVLDTTELGIDEVVARLREMLTERGAA